MFGLTRVPPTVAAFFAPFKRHFWCPQGRHFLLCQWAVVALLLDGGSGRLTTLASLLPPRISYWRLVRFLHASAYDLTAVLREAAARTLEGLPVPADRTCYLVVDPTLKQKRGLAHPTARKRRLNKFAPWVFGFEIVVVMASVGRYRVPVFVRIVDPAVPGHPNMLIREAIERFVPPSWARHVLVVGDAGLGANATITAIEARGFDWMFAMPRTRRFADGRSLRDRVTYMPRAMYRRCAATLPDGRRRDFWAYCFRGTLRGLGDVTIVLSKTRRTDGPKQVKILVTNRKRQDAGWVCSVYARRWGVETTIKELKGGLHMGKMQVQKRASSVEHSVQLSALAGVTLVWLYGRVPTTTRETSLFALKRRFVADVLREQHDYDKQRWEVRLRKAKRAA